MNDENEVRDVMPVLGFPIEFPDLFPYSFLREMTTTETYIECGCCGQFHKEVYWGDCRNDKERFFEDQIPKDSPIIYLPDEENGSEC